jgi:tripartite-type tricarboxylate transporter receptor subunit TctC
VFAAAGTMLTPLHAEDYPLRPVRLISPYGPGGSNDISARLLG